MQQGEGGRWLWHVSCVSAAWRALPIGILYNTELVKASEAPKTWDDLLSRKWTKKISMPDPTRHATTAQFLWNLQKLKGEKWLDYVKALAKQEPHLVESLAPVASVVIKGEADVGISYIKYVKQYQGPIAYVSMDKFISEPSPAIPGAEKVAANMIFTDSPSAEQFKRLNAELQRIFFAR